MKRRLIAITACLLTATAWAQSSSRPLNLKLPPSDLPTASTSTHAAAQPAHVSTAPGVYYGDTSGRMGSDETTTTAQACDDSTYNQPQVHGSVGMGVVGGNHVSGNYQTGAVNITRNLGSCDHPTGGVSVSIGVGQGHFHGH